MVHAPTIPRELLYTAVCRTVATFEYVGARTDNPRELLYTGPRRTHWPLSAAATLAPTTPQSYYTQARTALGPLLTTIAPTPTTVPRELLNPGAHGTTATFQYVLVCTDDPQRVIIHRRARHFGHYRLLPRLHPPPRELLYTGTRGTIPVQVQNQVQIYPDTDSDSDTDV